MAATVLPFWEKTLGLRRALPLRRQLPSQMTKHPLPVPTAPGKQPPFTAYASIPQTPGAPSPQHGRQATSQNNRTGAPTNTNPPPPATRDWQRKPKSSIYPSSMNNMGKCLFDQTELIPFRKNVLLIFECALLGKLCYCSFHE